MTIEVHQHNDQNALVNVDNFIQELQQELGKKKDAKVFFIHNPKIKGLVETSIDLLLIIAIENKYKNFHIISNESTNNQHPTTNNQQPTTNNQQPTTNNQQHENSILII